MFRCLSHPLSLFSCGLCLSFLPPVPAFADSLKNDQLLEGGLQLRAEVVAADKSGFDQEGQVQETALDDLFGAETYLAYTEEREYVHDGNPFNLDLPATRNPFEFSHQKHCDVFRHLKVPATPRRLDSYMRPEHIKRPSYGPPSKDQLFSSASREALYEEGVDIYGCIAFDWGVDLQSNTATHPQTKGIQPPWESWQAQMLPVLGIDLYSRLVSSTWKGGQIHASFTWPYALNHGPLYTTGNTLNNQLLGTRMYQGYFYTDVGRSRSTNSSMQGPRIFEYWAQQAWGKNNLNYVRIGAINPWITFDKSIVAGLFSSWPFDEPGSIGIMPLTGNGPIIRTAPPGISVAYNVGDQLTLKAMVAKGYWDPTGGVDNRRGFNQYWDDIYGFEYFYEATWRGGTYSFNSKDDGKPWFLRLGGQYHSGYSLDAYYDVNNKSFQLTNDERKKYWGNSQYWATFESMVYREPGSFNRGLTIFAKGQYSPWDTKGSLNRTASFGAAYEGVFGRDRDIFYLGIGTMWPSWGARRTNMFSEQCRSWYRCKVGHSQSIIEMGYSMEITPWFFVKPVLFWTIQPNMRTDMQDIVTLGLETRLAF